MGRWLEKLKKKTQDLPPEELKELKKAPSFSFCSSSQGGYPENRWYNVENRPQTPPEWDTETAVLVRWFEVALLSASPFDLQPYIRIVNPTRFYRSLRIDIAAGPAGPRARTGAMQADLRRLRDVLRGEN